MAKATNICVLNGPNLNMLGMREPGIYGHATLADIEAKCRQLAAEQSIVIDWFQSNSESALIDKIQNAVDKVDWIIINAAGLTHTSVALRDALSLFPGGVIEVHLSNIHTREAFRHNSLISAVAKGVIAGFGPTSYYMAINAIFNLTSET
ncbi:MAG: type II 3-dehydroquinate dehydratase [Candidatus Puniceispirillum sp.]|nr:type II 3-dehydroquinate dehydratase [Candidatus Puniceispirillum sp.]MBL6773786.1 type II 3-dehydroquinate dehydratase [Candidatus Puniceispirillum sp.]